MNKLYFNKIYSLSFIIIPMNSFVKSKWVFWNEFAISKRRWTESKLNFNIQLFCSLLCQSTFVMRCAIWYHLYNLKNVKKTHGGVSLLVKLRANTPPWVCFMFFKLYKWYQIAQNITYWLSHDGGPYHESVKLVIEKTVTQRCS